MRVKASRNGTAAAIEYFLYAIILLETGLAAFAYQAMTQVAQLAPLSRAYLALLYFGVLGWVFFQLNRLHRKRKQASLGMAKPEPPRQLPAASEPLQIAAPIPAQNQLSTPQPPPAELTPAAPAPVGVLPFGLTRTQLAVVLVVFLAALKGFTWMLANLVRP